MINLDLYCKNNLKILKVDDLYEVVFYSENNSGRKNKILFYTSAKFEDAKTAWFIARALFIVFRHSTYQEQLSNYKNSYFFK